MYEIYLVVSVFLIITGVASTAYFIKRLKRTKYKKCLVERLSDGLGAIFLGIFYFYCFFEFNHINSPNSLTPNLNFTHMEETFLNISEDTVMDPDVFTNPPLYSNATEVFTTLNYPTTAQTITTTTSNNSNFSSDFTENGSDLIINSTTIKDFNTASSAMIINNKYEVITSGPLPQTLENDTYNFYQSYFKDILKQKLGNNKKFANKTIFFNNREYRSDKYKPRTKRKLVTEDEKSQSKTDKRCFEKNFLNHALLISSFLYSVISLVNNTKLCYNQKQDKNETQNKVNTNNKEKISIENKNEKLFETVQIEKQIEGEISTETTKEPNMDIFLAKTSKNEETTIVTSTNEKNESNNKIIFQIIKLLLIWFTPGFCIYSLHLFMMSSTNSNNSTMMTSFPSTDFQHYFSATRSNPNMMKFLLSNSSSVNNVSSTQEKSREINDIIRNVYEIVGKTEDDSKMHEESTKSRIFDIVKYMNKKFKNNDQNEGNDSNCVLNTAFFKIHSFVLFCLVYFFGIFYSKMLQLKMKMSENENSKIMRNYILSFGVMWLPSILELLLRIYVFNENPSNISNLALALGNVFIVFNNFNNYLLSKNMLKISLDSNI